MKSERVQRYPLEWPLGWRRSKNRKAGTFKANRVQVNVEIATRRLETELDRLGADNATLSTNLTLNLRGLPRGDERPSDPGAAIYFTFKGRATVLACDTYFRVADNIAALAAHIEHLRAIERHGVGTIEQALAGYKALPADSAADWRQVFGFTTGQRVTIEELNDAYKRLAKERHPDVGGSDDAMFHLGRAKDFALAELAS